MNASKTDNPGNTIGDTWAKIESRFLLGQSSSYAIGATGGAATHTLTVKEMPSHSHATGYGWYRVRQILESNDGPNVIVKSWENIISDGYSPSETTGVGGGASSQQYATLSGRCYVEENSVAFFLEVL